METRLAHLSEELGATNQHAQAVLSSVRGTTETVRKSAVEQMGYYEAAGRRGAMALARLEILIGRADAHMERITQAFERSSQHADESIEHIGALAASARADMRELAEKGTELLGSSTEAVEQARDRLTDGRLDHIADALVVTSEKASEATGNAAEATGYLRDILSPHRKSFWLRLLELLIPRPTVSVP
jgi:hypothetical protein